MADSVSAIGALRTNTREIAQTKEQLIDINAAMQQELATQAELVSKGTTLSSRGVRTTPLAIKQEMMADMEAQSANQRRALTANFEESSLALIETISKQGAEQKKHLDEIQRINEGGILDQIIGMVTIPALATKAEVAGKQQQVAGQTLAQLNQAMQTSAKTSLEIQTRITEGTMDSMSSAIAADTAAEAAKIRANALATSATMVLQTAGLNEKQLDNKVKEYTIVAQEEQRAFMREQRELQRTALNKELRQEKITDQQLDLVNLALEANGKSAIPAGQRELVKDQMNKSGPQGEFFRELAFQGLTITTSGGKVVQGATPTEAAEFRQKVNYEPRTQQEQETLGVVNSLFGSKPVQEAKSNVEKIAAANKAVLDKLKADQDNINSGADSLAKPATWATLATSRAITESPAWKKVIEPSITENISTNYAEPADIYKRLVGGVTTGKIKINEAAQLFTNYAKFSMDMNNEASGLEKLTGYKQTKFTARLPQPATGLIPFLARTTDKAINAYLDPVTQFGGVTGVSGVAKFVPSASRSVNALDSVEVNNAMAASIAGELRKVPQ